MVEIKIPSPGESITEVVISRWLVKDGDFVEKDQPIAEIDSDKATLELTAEVAGGIKISAKEGETLRVGTVVATIDIEVKGPEKKKEGSEKKQEDQSGQKNKAEQTTDKTKAADANALSTGRVESSRAGIREGGPTPLAREIIKQNSLETAPLKGSGAAGKITKADVEAYMAGGNGSQETKSRGGDRAEERKKMSPLRKKLSQRLVAVKNQTAMLTTFNEVDMSRVMSMRNKFKDKFKEKYNVGLGFMSFFTKAVTHALQMFPQVNAAIDGDEIVYYNYADIGIAVSAPKGLMVPVLRNAEKMSFAEIEKNILSLATKARDGKISIDEMTGGTFTITNGGVFGSMLSTPILNPPQSAILGMHNIVERPVAINGKVEIRPIMYVALSYDHRVIDGKDSVGFLVKVKEFIEDPTKLLTEGKVPEEVLLGL